MRFYLVEPGTVRVKRWFALFPVWTRADARETRWLEMVEVEQERVSNPYGGDCWRNNRFIDVHDTDAEPYQ
jgi:hypothetical protein